jgi:hypothetical protein
MNSTYASNIALWSVQAFLALFLLSASAPKPADRVVITTPLRWSQGLLRVLRNVVASAKQLRSSRRHVVHETGVVPPTAEREPCPLAERHAERERWPSTALDSRVFERISWRSQKGVDGVAQHQDAPRSTPRSTPHPTPLTS